jgi:hypothetical protein
MPKFANRPVKLSTRDRIERNKSYQVRGYKDFLDLYPLGFGTLPEKIVYAALSARGIPFLYLNDIELTVPEIGFDQFFQADFIIPSLRIIIEVQGAHWHSMAKTIDEDAFKFALYQQDGWTALAWWDFDILNDINALFNKTPALATAAVPHNGNISSELAVQRRTKTDSSKGIRTLNARRGARLLYRKKAVTVKGRKIKTYGGYSTNGG